MANGIIGKVTAGGGTHLVTSTFYGTCTTAAGTAAKIVKLADATADAATAIVGMTLAVKFTNSNTAANPTLTVQRNGNTTNLIAAASIKAYGTTAPGTTVATSWRAGAVVLFVYVADGSNYYWTQVSSLDDNTTYTIPSAGTSATAVSTTASGGSATTWSKSDHVHSIALATGDNNGQVKIAGSNVSVKGLGTAAYTASTDYATSGHTHGNITNAGELSTASRAVVTDANKKITVADLSVSDPSASGSGITYIATISQNSQGKITATKSTVRDASASQSGVVSTAAQSFAGLKTFNGGITVGTSSAASSSSHSLWSTGITVHDTRYDSITVTSLSKAANLFFSNKEMPNTNWWAGIHMAGWTGDYSAWELVGPSHNADQRTTPLYIRSGRTTGGWGSWRKIYDTSNKPSISDHSYTPAGTITLTNGNTTTTVSAASSGATTYTPGGSVSQPTFTGFSLTSTGNFTPAGSVSVSTNATTNKTATVSAASSGDTTYTPGGTNSAPAFTGTAATIVVNGGTGTATYTPAGTIAVNGTTSTATVIKTATFNTVVTSATVANEILTISTGASGSSTNQTGVRIADPAYKFTGTGTRLTASYTPAGSVAAPTFTGTAVRLVTGNIAVPNTYTATFTGTQGSVSVSGTPAGTVSKPTFSGTAVRLVTGNISRPTSATFSGTPATLTHSIS